MGRGKKEDCKEKTSSLFMFFFNTCNSIVGNGIIVLPDATQKSGIGLSVLLACIAGIITALTSYLLIICSKSSKKFTYSTITKELLGTKFYFIIMISNTFLPLSMCAAYGIAIPDNLILAFKNLFPTYTVLQNRYLLLFLVFFMISLPFSLPKHVAILQYLSTLSIISVSIYIVIFISKTPEYASSILVLPEAWNFGRLGVAQALSSLSLSFTAHHNILLLYGSLKNNTLRRFSIGIHAAVAFCGAIYFIVMICGYISFAGVISGNILNHYCIKDTVMVYTRLLFTFSLITTLPIQAITAREACQELFLPIIHENIISRSIFAVAVYVFCYLISILPINISTVIEIGGALTAVPLMMIFPPLLYLKATKKSVKPSEKVDYFLWGLIITGILIMITAIYMSVKDAVSFSNNQMRVRYWCGI